MSEITVETVPLGSPRYAEELELRFQILRKPLGMDRSTVGSDAEGTSLHLVAIENGKVVGCVVMTPLDPQTVKLRAMAVADSHQGRGVGRQLVQALEVHARERHAKTIVLNARKTAIPFYASLGYAEVGPEFTEVTIPHRKMTKSL